MFFPPPLECEVETERKLLVLTVPDWFERDDFHNWRRGRIGFFEPATWNAHASYLTEYDDIFMTFHRDLSLDDDEWEGSDVDNDMPAYVYAGIGKILHEYNLHEGVLWLRAC